MSFDLSRLGDWSKLPFFTFDLPAIAAELDKETAAIYPPRARTFAALERCQPKDCKAVILGQDPYHTPGKADGLAFSIPNSFTGRLDSLGNIIKELEADLGAKRRATELTDWADNGVLLLNTALSVPDGQPGAHAKLGWSRLVREVLIHLSDAPRAYLLWGAHAQKVAKDVDGSQNLKIETAHPSPLSASRGFFGSRPFSSVNQWLKDRGEPEIDWVGPQ